MSRRRIALRSLAFFLLASCRGPDPVVEQQTLLPASSDGAAPFRVEAVVVNRGGGSGQVGLRAVIVRRTDGEVVAEASKEIDLAPHERTSLVLEMARPSAAQRLGPDDLELSVRAQYPIE